MNTAIDDYITKQQPTQKEVLLKIKEVVKGLLPEAEERMSYGVPSFRLHGKSFMYAAFTSHVGIYPDPEVITHFEDELVNYQTSKGTIKFSLNKAIPYDLIKKIVAYKYSI